MHIAREEIIKGEVGDTAEEIAADEENLAGEDAIEMKDAAPYDIATEASAIKDDAY